MTRHTPLPPETPCPRCKEGVLATERFCPACGADLRWTLRKHASVGRVPRGVDISHFQVPADRAASRALAAAAPVQAAVRYYLRRVAEPEYRTQLLGNAVRAGPRQLPRLHRLARYCERTLHTAPVEVYLATSTEASAYTFGSNETEVIVLPSSLVDILDDTELLFVIGSQLGHVKADHVVYMTVAKALSAALKGIPALGAALSGAANFLLVPWQRTAMLTADRAGLLCCQDLRTASLLIARQALGAYTSSFKSLDLATFLGQAKDLERSEDWGDTWKARPALARRIRELERFHDSPEWARLFEGAWDPLAPRFSCYYCPGGGAPERADAPLDALRCQDCGRDLMVEEVPCPTCCAPLEVTRGASLASLECGQCKAPFLGEDRRARLRLEGDVEPAGSAYGTLGVTSTATPSQLRRAFRERMEPLEGRVAGLGGVDPTRAKLKLFAAFKVLIDPLRRAEHDRQLAERRLLDRLERSPTTRAPCRQCGGPIRGEWCGLCGAPRVPPEKSRPALLAILGHELETLGATDAGEYHEDPRGAFEFAFHTPERALFFRRCPGLARPGAIRRLFRDARDLLALTRPGQAAQLYAVLEGPLDEELFTRLAMDLPQATRDDAFPVTLLRPGEPDGLEVLRLRRDKLDTRRAGDAAAWVRATLDLEDEGRG